MGYYTTFKLNFALPKVVTDFADKLKELGIDVPPDVQIQQTTDALEASVIAAMEQEELYGIVGFLNHVYDGDSESMKWYEWEDDMRFFSKKFPTVLFTLNGEGEENDDMWKAYFKNGKMQFCKAKIAFDPFNEKELK